MGTDGASAGRWGPSCVSWGGGSDGSDGRNQGRRGTRADRLAVREGGRAHRRVERGEEGRRHGSDRDRIPRRAGPRHARRREGATRGRFLDAGAPLRDPRRRGRGTLQGGQDLRLQAQGGAGGRPRQVIFGTLWSAAKATLETSHAFAAAKKAYDDGGGLPAIVSAWAAETSSAGDDLYATKVEAALRIVAGWVRSAAVLGVKA